MTIYLFSAAILLNSFSMTALMLICGLAGAPGLTADIAVVQGATLALFYAFSGNARNVIFADRSGTASRIVLRTRLILLLPLSFLSFVFSSMIGSVGFSLSLILIGRRCSEWIGEVYLSDHEVHGFKKTAVLTTSVECVSLVITLILIFIVKIDPAISMILWAAAPLAAAPLAAATQGKLARSQQITRLMETLSTLAPNLGSTTIIGITAYIFRLSIISLIGRIPAGDLFTAFAIGGLLPTIYNNSIGPSLALRAHREGKKLSGAYYISLLGLISCLIGIGIAVISSIYPQLVLHKTSQFWNAVGLSLAGGSIMMFALHIRIIMLQNGRNIEIFGTDVLSNILIVIAVPYFYLLFGTRSLEGLYLFNAVLTLCFYWSTERLSISRNFNTITLYIVAGLLIVPLFFQIDSGIFRDSSFIFDTGRVLGRLPIPVSVIGLAGGILLLGQFRATHRSLMVFFFTSLLFVLALVLIESPKGQIERLVLMTQYLLPLLALVLGEMYGKASTKNEFEKASLSVLCFIVPVQIICSWIQGLTILSPYLYIFSIYQHLLYVPGMLVLGYGIAFIGLRGKGIYWKYILAAMMPLIVIYIVASYSIIACVIFIIFMVTGLLFFSPAIVPRRVAYLLIGIVLMTGLLYGTLTRTSAVIERYSRFAYVVQKSMTMENAVATSSSPRNFKERLYHWEFFASGIISDGKSFVFGHSRPPDRRIHPSAYNYYLDLIYNFGFLVAVPLLFLIGNTLVLAYRKRHFLLRERNLLPFLIAVFFVFLVDNLLKVGLRQPYPGIFGFFLLGMLQAKLVMYSDKRTFS